MSAPAVAIRGLSKTFRLQGRRRVKGVERSVLASMGFLLQVARAGGHAPPPKQARVVRALREVDLEVPPGQVLGIIGRNGAGKSTLLNVLARVIRPTAGHVEVRGRVVSLLQMGLGFDPALTLRENIQLYGRLAGVSGHELRQAEAAILEFAELTEFRDTILDDCPSGSFVRLAFSAMMHLSADVVLADEVLAVGDAGFRASCERRIRDVATRGETVLFVSHDMDAIRRCCSRVVWIDYGRIRDDGPTDRIVDAYLRDLLPQQAVAIERGSCRLMDLRLLSAAGAQVGALDIGAEGQIDAVFAVANPDVVARLAVELWYRGPAGDKSMHVLTAVCPQLFEGARGAVYRAAVQLPRHFLNESTYEAKARLLVAPRQDPQALRPVDGEGQQSVEFGVLNIAPESSVWSGWRWGRKALLSPRLDWRCSLDGGGSPAESAEHAG